MRVTVNFQLKKSKSRVDGICQKKVLEEKADDNELEKKIRKSFFIEIKEFFLFYNDMIIRIQF
jgi:hypothetical protein